MNPTGNKRGSALDNIPASSAAPVAMLPKPRHESADKIKASFFISRDTHEKLVELRKTHKISQQQVFAEALDMYLKALGESGLIP
jgi:hypothetical protein